ncbi:MAG: hypothetical protein AB4372_25090 [Xenococcus sp. (in: cyanobacteria)]
MKKIKVAKLNLKKISGKTITIPLELDQIETSEATVDSRKQILIRQRFTHSSRSRYQKYS